MVLMLLLISLISFFAVNLAPHSFLSAGALNPNLTPEAIEHLKAVYGLDKSLVEQYIGWMKALVQFDFGISFSSGKPVIDEIVERLPVTLWMNVVSMVLIFIGALYLGIKSALKSSYDNPIKQFALISYAMPGFYLAIILMILLSVELKWFPISGLHSTGAQEMMGAAYYLDMAWHLALPVFVIVFGGVGSLSLYVRSLTKEILKSDAIFFARSRGFEDSRLIWHYILPNLSPPIVTILGLSLPGLIGGSVILESIFSINGMGLLFYQSALSRDYPVIMGILIIGAFLTLLGNIIADAILLKINPYYTEKK